MGLKPVIPPGLYKESSGGSGDVAGPASATDNALVRFDGTTGKLVQNSDVTLADAAASNVTMTAGTGLSLTLATLDGNKNLIFDIHGTGVFALNKGITLTQATANASILASTGYSLTGSNATSMIDLAGTWNTSGAPTAIKLNITNTSSGASSLLMDLQIDGASAFSVSKTGSGIFGSNLQAYNITATNGISVGSNVWFVQNGSGILQLWNGSFNNFDRLQLGGTTSSFPAIKRNGAGIDVVLADDSGYARITVSDVVIAQTAEPTPVSNSALFYSEDTAGTAEMFVANEAGTETQLSPHTRNAPKSMYDRAPGLEHITESIQRYAGTVTYIQHERSARLAGMLDSEKAALSPEQRETVRVETFAENNTRLGKNRETLDWATVQAAHIAKREAEQASWDAQLAQTEAKRQEVELQRQAIEIERQAFDALPADEKEGKTKPELPALPVLPDPATRPADLIAKPAPVFLTK